MYTMIVLFLFLALTAKADDSNYNNTIIGERAFGLGGAFTALSDDSSGIFYNPAGIVDANKDSFSLSSSLYSLQSMKLKKPFVPVDEHISQDIEASTFVTIPSTVGSLWQINKRVTAGFNTILYDLRKIKIDDMARLVGDSDVGYNREAMYIRDAQDQILFVGPGIGLKLSERLSVGMAGFYVMRTFEDKTTWGDKLWVEDPIEKKEDIIRVQSLSQGITLETGSIVGLFGLKYYLTDHLKMGFSLRTRSWRISEEGKIFSTQSYYDKNAITAAVTTGDFKPIYDTKPHFGSRSEGISSDSVIPYKFAFGTAYEVRNKFTVTMDLNYHNGYRFNLLNVKGFDPEIVPLGRVDQKPVFNTSIGFEYILKEQFPIRCGAYTNFSSAPRVKPNIYSTQEHIDIFGGTFSIGKEDQNFSTNMGLSYTYGWGKSPLPFGDPQKFDSLDITTTSLSLMMGGSYYF